MAVKLDATRRGSWIQLKWPLTQPELRHCLAKHLPAVLLLLVVFYRRLAENESTHYRPLLVWGVAIKKVNYNLSIHLLRNWTTNVFTRFIIKPA